MEISERIKSIRGTEKQEDFAKSLLVNKNTVGRWERGEQIPNMEDINRILEVYIDINPTWLLTGLGEMRCKHRGWWGKIFYELRGGLTYLELANKINFIDPEKGALTIQAVEEGRIEPSLDFVEHLMDELEINPNWMFGVSDAPKFMADEKASKNIELDTELLKMVYEVIDDIDSESHLLTATQKAELFAFVYKMNAGINYTKDRLKRFIEAVCSLIEQGIDFNKLSEHKLSNVIVEIAHHVVKG